MGTEAPAIRPTRTTSPPAQKPTRPRTESPKPAPSAVPDGIDYHSRTIKTFGPLAALVPMAASGLASMLFLWGSQSTLRGVIGFALAIVACPTLAAFGFPVTSSGSMWIATVISSAVVWIAIGSLAARRATDRAVAGWREWRGEWLRLAIGIWIGSIVGLAIAALLLTVDF